MIRSRITRKIAVAVAVAFAAVTVGLSLTVVSPTPAGADPVTPQEADADQNLAYRSVDGYWSRHWSDNFTGRYAPPINVGLYDSRQAPVPCAGGLWTSNNAWYCGATDSVGFDLKFMERVYELGDSFIFFVVAHEWGHAIQSRLVPDIQAVRRELQADCLAGAALFGAARDGTVQFEDGEARELINSLNSVADEYPWTMTGDHGNADERIANFRTGFNGPMACLPELPPHLQQQRPDPGIPPPPPPGTL